MDLPSFGQDPSPEIDFLYALRRGKTRLGLASMRRLFRSLGHPERAVPMAHVAGTNGKGSTTAHLAAMLGAGGLRVGRFTSPHLLSIEERISIDAVPIPADALRQHVRDLRPWIEAAGASFFEAMTAIAAVHFRAAGVQVAVYEVGLGGRLDSTNAIPSHVSLLTSVGHDHEAILGRGLRAVCGEKLGIVKRGVPLFAALERRDLVRLARQVCSEHQAPLTLVGPDTGRVLELDLEHGTTLELRTPVHTRLTTRLLGAHQVRNVALAAHAALDLWERGVLERRPDLVEGAARAFLPGRFQVLPGARGEPTIVLDVGHNPEAIEVTLDVFDNVLPGVRPVIVLGLLDDKKLGGAAARLARTAREIVLTAPAVQRAWDPRRGLQMLPAGRGLARRTVVPRVADALDHALGGNSDVVLLLGSHYVLGEAVPALAQRRGMTPAALLMPPEARPWRATG